MDDYIIRPITAADDPAIAGIIRRNLEHYHLDIPGTAYFDKELDSLSRFYNAMPVEGVEKLADFIRAFDKNN